MKNSRRGEHQMVHLRKRRPQRRPMLHLRSVLCLLPEHRRGLRSGQRHRRQLQPRRSAQRRLQRRPRMRSPR